MLQPFAVAVIVKVVVCVLVVPFCNVPLIVVLVPLDAMPEMIDVLSLVQEYVVPTTLLFVLNTRLVIAVSSHIVCAVGVATI